MATTVNQRITRSGPTTDQGRLLLAADTKLPGGTMAFLTTTKGPRPIPESVQKLDSDMRFRTKAEIDAAAKKRDELRLELRKLSDTGKMSPKLSECFEESKAPKECYEFSMQNHDIARQNDELNRQAEIEDKASSEAVSEIRRIAPLLDEATQNRTIARGVVETGNVNDEAFDKLLATEIAHINLTIENRRQHLRWRTLLSTKPSEITGTKYHLLTKIQVGEIFGVSRTTIGRWEKHGQLRSVAVPGSSSRRFLWSEVERLIESLTTNSATGDGESKPERSLERDHSSRSTHSVGPSN